MARGSIVRRPSGNYAIVYYVGGKQKWETVGPSRREAERALTARKREVDTGTWREPSSETLASYAERWLAHRDPARVGGGGRTRLSPSTFEGYRLNVRRHVLPRLGRRTLSSLRTEDVDRLIADLEAVKPIGEIEVRVSAEDTPTLLLRWLAELLYVHETQRLLFSRFEVEVSGTSLLGRARGEAIDKARHELKLVIKAVTRHRLTVDPERGIAEVIFDI